METEKKDLREKIKEAKWDEYGEYDIAFGKYYRENHTKRSIIPAEQIAGNRNLNELFEIIMDDAIDVGAMNIDISLDQTGYGLVEFRIGRDMVLDRVIDKDAVRGLSIVARRKSGVNYEREYVSDISGSMRYEYLGTTYDIRCAYIYTVQGMSLSLRILYPSSKLDDISNLGFPTNVESAYRDALKANQGLILLTGATGSGKTTSQYAGINTIMSEFGGTKNIRTIEDPVEYTVPGIKQTPVNVADGDSFGSLLKMFFRGNPDVILVGEINDAETAITAIRAATSGHLVMSTMHTNNTIEVTRVMQHYGANYVDLGNALQLVMNQELENRLCTTCRKPTPITTEDFQWVQQRLGVDDTITILYEASGEVEDGKCPDCEGRGYRGSTLIVEMLEANYAYQRALNKVRDNTFELEKELQEDDDANFYPIGRDVFRHLKEGNIDITTAKRIMKKQTGESLADKKKKEKRESERVVD